MTSQRAFRIPKVAAMSNVLAVVIVVLFALPFIVTATTVIDFSMLEDLILAYYSYNLAFMGNDRNGMGVRTRCQC
ncbi:hypothetical protein SISSUDRAFT_894090 [Sistotremastrum suecicum HHB10207 ss-3]|uniref:Uncharacterized protein n=1 Tax=Sistotremastrum suecicum HHB10207 ss-3 TaxID=1314776 RepID=A0A166HDL8_9AGAM|nr:hypothetical protein SISSUDRAFT_894090 [Sistotremastrum suecicum HHB10207 ss-3]